jgi:hypothetical protein
VQTECFDAYSVSVVLVRRLTAKDKSDDVALPILTLRTGELR